MAQAAWVHSTVNGNPNPFVDGSGNVTRVFSVRYSDSGAGAGQDVDQNITVVFPVGSTTTELNEILLNEVIVQQPGGYSLSRSEIFTLALVR